MSEPKFYTVFEADSAYLKALGDTNTYFSEFEVRLKTLEALGGKIDDSITSLLEVEKKILETVGGIATTTNDIFELRKEIAKAQGLDVNEDFNIWDVAQQEPPVGPKIFTIRFLNWDGTVLETVEVEEGQTPLYVGTEPTKESDETYDYTFNGWLPEISPANGNVDYVAKYIATEKSAWSDDLTLPYVTFVAEENGSNIQLIGASKNDSPYWEYSYDLNNWTKINGNTAADLPLNKGNVVYVRGYTGYTADSAGRYRQIKVTGKVAAYGNANALLNFNDLNAALKEYCGCKLFEGSTGLTKAPELPATTLANRCYLNMFYGCTSLTKAPELPATTLGDDCYRYMFYGCTALTQAPELPATTLAAGCYSQMFYGCTSLVEGPEILPATTLKVSCYIQMFSGCTSLTKAPVLPATILKASCYQYMFIRCTSLQEITCLATDISASNCISDWVRNVPAGGTFYKNPSMTTWTTGEFGIPKGWTVVDYAG